MASLSLSTRSSFTSNLRLPARSLRVLNINLCGTSREHINGAVSYYYAIRQGTYSTGTSTRESVASIQIPLIHPSRRRDE
jgi:hypothetical protein